MSGALLAAQTAAVNISFTEIPANLQVPGAYLEIAADYSQAGLLAYPARALLMAPILSGGTITPLSPTQVFTVAQAAELLGANGIGAQMVAAFLAANPWTPLYVMGLPTPSSATAATWAVQVQASGSLSGPDGTLSFYIGGQQFSVPYIAGVSTGSTMLTALAAAINAANIPFTSNTPLSNASNLTLTARDSGALANGIDLRFNLNPGDATPGGQVSGTNNLSTGVTATAGTGVHDVAGAFAAIPSSWFTHCVCPWTDSASQTAIAAETARRFNAMAGLDMRVFSAASAANLSALVAVPSGNDRFTSIALLQNEPSPPWVIAATYAAVAIFALVNDPARQLKGLVLPGIVKPASVDILTETEREQILTSGGATLVFGNDGLCRIERAVTTYLTAAGSIPDTAWMDIMTAETASRIRYDWISYVGLTYPRQKMAADGSLAAEYDDTIVTPRRMSGAWTARSRLYEQVGWIQNSAATAKQSVFYLDPSNPNRMDARMQYQQMGNLMVFAGQLQFTLSGQSAQG